MKTVNILFIGNSYSRNLETFMPFIAKEYGIKLNVVNLYFGGCSINQHVDFISNNKAVYEIDSFNANTNHWTYSANKTFKDVIKLAKWDYVSLQQCSIYSGYDNKKEWANLKVLKELVEKSIRPISKNFKFIWHMTWSYAAFYPLPDSYNAKFFNKHYIDTVKMEMDIRNTYRHEIVLDKDFKKTIFSGEVISYMRRFVDIGVVSTPDAVHLYDKWGCFPIALGAIKSLFDIDINSLKETSFKLLNYSINNDKRILSFTTEEFRLLKKILSICFNLIKTSF